MAIHACVHVCTHTHACMHACTHAHTHTHTLYYITLHGSKVSEKDCRKWHKSYNFRNIHSTTEAIPYYMHTHINIDNAVNLHYVHKPSREGVSVLDTRNSSTD
jgi:hypothetical protein